MKKNLLMVMLSYVILSAGVSWAITITAFPNPAVVNQNVIINATTTFPNVAGAPPACTLEVSFGDGSPWVDMGVCTNNPCNLSLNHRYTTPGKFTIMVRNKGGNFCPLAPVPPDPAAILITVQCIPLNISSPAGLLSGQVGRPYSYAIQTTGGQPPIAFSLAAGSLPPGLNLGPTGVISGTPTGAGNYNFTIMATDTCAAGPQRTRKAFSAVISAAPCPPLDISSPSVLPSGQVGQTYSYAIQTTGGQPPIIFSLAAGSLPPGLNLGPTGMISGIPTGAGNYNFIIMATDTCAAGPQRTRKAFSVTVIATPVRLSVIVSPPSIRIPRGTPYTENIYYTFSATPADDMEVNSSLGVFRANNNVIGEVNRPLGAIINNGAGRVSEVLNIPVSILKRAESLGTSRVNYSRVFTDGTVYTTGQTELIGTTEAGAEFRITRVQLYFENRRAETTVKRNQTSLKAYADIRFVGSGFLQGYWEVDGRLIENVNRHLVYGRSVTIESSDVPAFPTFDPGTHIVRFVITGPLQEILLPEALYFVTAEESEDTFFIKLLSPLDDAEIDYLSPAFKWEGGNKAIAYLIEFLKDGKEKPVFSAYTKGVEYSLPSSVLKDIFVPGEAYQWKVKGFDAEGGIAGESPLCRFLFKELSSCLPGEIVVVTKKQGKGSGLAENIGAKYGLRLLEAFDIESLGLSVVIFYTEKEILQLINAIMKEDGVILAQPNYISRTMSEPMSDMQNIYKILNLNMLHKHYRGAGVKVAVIDTGVDTNHRDLKARIVSLENLMQGPYRAEIHGTALAGVIGACINEYGIEGIAPEVEILVLRACKQVSKIRPEGTCYTTSVSKALDSAIENGAKIVNMGFGSFATDKLIARLITEGAKRGMIFVAPVGNMAVQENVAFPASHADVIAAGGMDKAGNLYPNKALASAAMVCAPYKNVFTTIPDNRHNFISGTSISSAVVSGILAVAAQRNQSLGIKDIPLFDGDICKWEEELLNMPLCKKKQH